MALGPLKPVFCALAGTGLAVSLVTACETRDVFLVPRAQLIEQVPDAGRPSMPGDDASIILPPFDGGTIHKDAAPTVCETSRFKEEARPLGVYILVDQSSAMKARWGDVRTALTKFIGETDRLGKVSIGIQFFAKLPTPTPATADEFQAALCDWRQYEIEDVPISPTQDSVQRISQSLESHGPSQLELLISPLLGFFGLPLSSLGESPIDAAIHGGIAGARRWIAADSRALRKAAVLIVTDKIDTSTTSRCTPTLAEAMAEAEKGIVDSPQVPTYLLGVGGPNPDLDKIAAKGGTVSAYTTTSADLMPSLEAIRDKVLPCDVDAGDPAKVNAVSKNLFNVDLLRPERTERLFRVPTKDACGDPLNEWYSEMDETTGKTTVRLCPNSCAYARAMLDATLEVVLGCRTNTR